MSLSSRPQQVRALLVEPSFTDRFLQRITAHLDFEEGEAGCFLGVMTDGCIVPSVLEGAYVVRITSNESLAACIQVVTGEDGESRLALGPWQFFVNADTTDELPAQGVYLWLGASWRHIPHHHDSG